MTVDPRGHGPARRDFPACPPTTQARMALLEGQVPLAQIAAWIFISRDCPSRKCSAQSRTPVSPNGKSIGPERPSASKNCWEKYSRSISCTIRSRVKLGRLPYR